MKLARIASVVLLAAGFGALAAETASAASTICMRLEARLAAIDGGGRSGGGRFERAAREQRAALRTARAQAQRANCRGGFLFFRSRQDARCEALLSRIGEMEANLSRLEARAGRQGGGGSRAERNATLRALGENDCGPRYARHAPRGGLRLFSRDGYYNEQGAWVSGGGRGGEAVMEDTGRQRVARGSGYRTLCVRTCDGYYFPISHSSSSSVFGIEESLCQARCPGTEVALYAHPNWSEDVGDAVSLAGARYSDLPTAFAYRRDYNPSCTCRGATETAMTVIAGGYDPSAVLPSFSAGLPPVPEMKPARGEDPETLANRAGDFDPRDAVAPPRPTPVASLTPTPDESGKIRRVGPSYFYAQ